jgi:hypothetical protein
MELVDAFLKQGAVVLHRFGLGIIKTCRDQILQASETGKIMSVICSPPEEFCEAIVKLAVSEENGIKLNAEKVQQFREKAQETYKHLLVATTGQDSTRKHTGETDSEDETEEDDPECLVCHDEPADIFCKECNTLICERCNKKDKKEGHSKTDHTLERTDDWDFDRLVELFLKLRTK